MNQMNYQTRKKVVGLLESAATVLMIPGAWAKGAEAKLSNGNEVEVSHPRACTFCSIGALSAASLEVPETGAITQRGLYNLAVKELNETVAYKDKYMTINGNSGGIVDLNDNTTKAKVLEAWAETIDRLNGVKA